MTLCVDLQVVIGKRKQVIKSTEASTNTIIGLVALIDVPSYAGEWPQVGRIQRVRDTLARR
jgi:hypothetical protein